MNDSTREVEDLARNGFPVFPVREGSKVPTIKAWPDQATRDQEQIGRWFSRPANVGIRCGRTDEGVSFFVVDVDVKDDQPGRESWADFCGKNPEVAEYAKRTIMATTPSGGYHFYFLDPTGTVRNGKPWPGVDIRGEGGYVLAPPSSLVGQGRPYEWVRGPDEYEVLEAPPELIEALVPRETPAPVTAETGVQVAALGGAGVSSTVDETPGDWARRNLSIARMLDDTGWQYMETKGDDHYWCRPGKDPRDGHSAVVHGDAPMVIWSTSAPAEFWRAGKDTADGGRVLSPLEVFAATQHRGDVSTAARDLRRNAMPMSRPPGTKAAPQTVDVEDDGPRDHASMNLPDEFWESTDFLRHVAQAADARLVSREAALASVLTRVSAKIPPAFRIPAIVGAQSTFDFITCVVADSSGGKSISNGVAGEIIAEDSSGRVLMDQRPGSGEGLIQAFMDYERDEKNRKIGDPSYKHSIVRGIHFTVDEGTGLMEQGGRAGTTIIQTLCSAWSGSGMGQLNASDTTKRLIPARMRRVSATINIQTSEAASLFQWKSVGLPQRILFATAHGPDFEIVDFPGTFAGKNWPTQDMPREMEYPPEVVAEVRQLRQDVRSGRAALGDLDGHRMLLRLKLAGILALCDHRQHVTALDWTLAEAVLASSDAVRAHIEVVRKDADLRAVEAAGHRQGVREAAAETVKERQAVARLRDSIIRKVDAAGADGIATNKLRKATTSSATKHRFEAALEAAVDDGAIVQQGDRWILG